MDFTEMDLFNPDDNYSNSENNEDCDIGLKKLIEQSLDFSYSEFNMICNINDSIENDLCDSEIELKIEQEKEEEKIRAIELETEMEAELESGLKEDDEEELLKTQEPEIQADILGNDIHNIQSQLQEIEQKNKLECGICFEVFEEKEDLKNHDEEYHPELKSKECKQCNKFFSSKNQLVSHLRSHSGVKPYKCKQCEKCFSIKSHLKRHLNIHLNKKPFQCSQCNRAFNQSGNLKEHLKTHINDRPFKCKDCEKSFKTKHALLVHADAHAEIKKHVCQLCGNAYSLKRQLQRHQVKHSGADDHSFLAKKRGRIDGEDAAKSVQKKSYPKRTETVTIPKEILNEFYQLKTYEECFVWLFKLSLLTDSPAVIKLVADITNSDNDLIYDKEKYLALMSLIMNSGLILNPNES